MNRDFSQNFYDLKRSALLSSLLLFLIAIIGPRIASDAKVFIFQITQQDGVWVIGVVAAAAVYYNLSFFVSAFIEVREIQTASAWSTKRYDALVKHVNDVGIALAEPLAAFREDLDLLRKTQEALRRVENYVPTAMAEVMSAAAIHSLKSKEGSLRHELFVAIDERLFDVRGHYVAYENYAEHVRSLAGELAKHISKAAKSVVAKEAANTIATYADSQARAGAQLDSAIRRFERKFARHQRAFAAARSTISRHHRDMARWRYALNTRIYVFDIGVPALAAAAAATSGLVLLWTMVGPLLR